MYGKIDEYYRAIMTKSLAEDVKQWRVVEECSYRKVHQKFQEKYVDKKDWSISEELVKHFGLEPYGKQIDGLCLVGSAMDYLQEDGWI